MRRLLSLFAGVIVSFACAASSLAQDKPATPPAPADKLILGPGSNWHYFYTIMPPVLRKEGKLETVKATAPKEFYGGGGSTVGQWLDFPTPGPASGWEAADFNDLDWHRKTLVDPDAPWIGFVAMRSRFSVDDPAKVTALKLSATYYGGLVVYVNGKEVARANVPVGTKYDGVADDFATDDVEKAAGSLAEVPIPANTLRKGVNVLAIAVYRSAYPESWVDLGKNVRTQGMTTIKRGPCGLTDIKLTSAAADPVTPSVRRPDGFQVWNSSIMSQDFLCDYGDPNDTLKPIRIIAPRGGAGSGKVVVGSKTPIKGLTATATGFSQKGPSAIAQSNVQVRYGLGTAYGAGEANGARAFQGLFCCDTLDEVPPAEVKVNVPNLRLPWQEYEKFQGAVVSVWVTVTVPAETAPGEYSGSLTVNLPDGKAVSVPLELTVCKWRVPPTADWATVVEVVESPESVALAYNLPMWSEAHWKLIDKSLTLLGQVSADSCYIPLICDTNQGNDESMVRWIKQPDGTYKYDLSIMERYLDDVVKFQGKPRVVCLYVWDCYLEGGLESAASSDITDGSAFGKPVAADREAHRGKGPIVTMLDPATGKTEKGVLPMYSNPRSRELWKPLMAEVMAALKKRGLDGAAQLGIITDVHPTKEVISHFLDVSPDLAWVYHGHERFLEVDPIKGGRLGFTSVVAAWDTSQFLVDPSVERLYGWRTKGMVAHNPRVIYNSFSPTTWWFMGEMNVTGRQQGFARIGGDFFNVLKNAKGEAVGTLSARFPASSWRMLNIVTSALGQGKEAPVATGRLEMMREGLQECEARIFMEKVLLDPEKRAKLGEPLAKSIQDLLDARMRNMFRAVTTLRNGCFYPASWWGAAPVLGSQWYCASGWQNESIKLYDAAFEVEKKLGSSAK